MPVITAPRRRLAIVLAASLAAVLGGLVTIGNASATPGTPTSMAITAVSSGFAAPAGTPSGAVPTVLAKAGAPITIHVAFFIGATPASFNQDTSLKITTNVGTLSPSTGVAPAGQTYADLTTSPTTAVNNVRLTVTVSSGKAKGLTTSAPDSLVFDVLTDIKSNSSAGTGFTDGIGGDTGCTSATATNPVCGIVLLPKGAGAGVLLSIGACDTAGTYAPCFVNGKKTGGAVVQTLFGQPAQPYTTTSPAVLIIKCDKTLCGTGAIQGLTVSYSLLGNGALTDALPCPGKNTMASPGVPCVDYVQSKRDGSGDTLLYLLTDQDMRGSVG